MDETTRDHLMAYIRDLFAPEDAHLQQIRSETVEHGMPQIEVSPEEGRMLQFLVAAAGARRIVEIGTLAGYSATWMARALPADGELVTLEIDEEHANLARQMFERAGLGDRVDVRVGPALETLHTLEGTFDAVFIDADKRSYPDYLAWAVEHIRLGGLIVAHNAFMQGRVVDETAHDEPPVAAMLAFNRVIADHPDLLGTIIPIGDGILAAVRSHS